MEYRTVNAQSTEDLDRMVNEAIKESWVPQGSLAAAPWSYRKQDGIGTQVSGCTYSQALIRDIPSFMRQQIGD